jgi:hypothetical protein
MGVLERMEQQATILGKGRAIPRRRDWGCGIAHPITDYDADRDVQLIKGVEMRAREIADFEAYDQSILQGILNEAARQAPGWKQGLRDIEDAGVPMNLAGGFAGLEGVVANGPCQPLPTALGAVAFVSGDFSPYTATTYCPVPNRSAVTCDFYGAFTLALAGTPWTLLVTPGVGTALSAKNLGAGVATATLGTTGTAGLILKGELTVCATGSGAGGAWYFTGWMLGKLATSGNGTADVNQIIGFVRATGDSTAQNGLWMTCTGTATSVTITTQQLRFGSWN